MSVIPTIRYADAGRMVDWLCEAFQFDRHLVVESDDGTVIHAQLTWFDGMIMLSQAQGNPFDEYQKPPGEVGGPGSSSAYIMVSDLDDHYAQAAAAGADIVLELDDHGQGPMYSCRDPEGQLWNFGTYDPWGTPHDV